eukprot:TRINITY_DN4962_c0_g1_i1.p1 TRINITY_DN4962_c0_g1~~TRINITY_DN4962_c0_g1_i1.p1  ORF type:complete len:221 (+),score=49.39 TRINITY_DN4962_c0_g1_i1:99-761(+)
MQRGLVGSEMCIRDRYQRRVHGMLGSEVYKIVVLGAARVGKTSLTEKYVNKTFSDHRQKTMDASYLSKECMLDDKSIVTLNIWDTAGQEIYHAMAQLYYRDADGAVIVFDLGDIDTFETADKWLKELKQFVGEIPIVIAGNKCDLPERVVPEKKIADFAEMHGAKYLFTSAKSGENTEELFKGLSEVIHRKKKVVPKKMTGNIKFGRESVQPKKTKSSCC